MVWALHDVCVTAVRPSCSGRSSMHRLLAASLGLAAVIGTAEAQEFTFRLHSFSSPTSLDHTMHLDRWAERVEAASDGRIRIEIFPAMQLGGAAGDLVQQLEDGVVDMIWTVAGFTPGRFPGMEGIELPFMNTGLSATMSPAAMEFALEHLQDEFDGIKIISIHTTDRAILHTVDKPVRTKEDLEGMRIRVAGRFIGEAVRALGGVPVGIPLPGVYEALARGQVDGMYINWAITLPYRFYEVTNYQTDTALFQGTLLTLMSQDAYDRLPDDLKAVIDAESGIAYAKRLGEIWDGQTEAARQATIDAGNEVFELTPEERARWIEAVRPAYDAWIAEMNRLGRDGEALFEAVLEITAKYGRN
ncbi:MAG: C4-dicarboxylate ABC transporter [Geminicoccaceae bacterium]|nr:MAG: C4-dicarboxylate ABC transporter [Geminicoccaceae bacterium]